MKTEELLRYEAEYRAMQEAFGTFLLVFEFPNREARWGNKLPPHPDPLARWLLPLSFTKEGQPLFTLPSYP